MTMYRVVIAGQNGERQIVTVSAPSLAIARSYAEMAFSGEVKAIHAAPRA